MKILFECPYPDCGFENPTHIDLNNPQPKMIYCDLEDGGCDRKYVAWIEAVSFDRKIQALDCEDYKRGEN